MCYVMMRSIRTCQNLVNTILKTEWPKGSNLLNSAEFLNFHRFSPYSTYLLPRLFWHNSLPLDFWTNPVQMHDKWESENSPYIVLAEYLTYQY